METFKEILNSFSNRDYAIIFWFVILVLWGISKVEIRKSFGLVLKSLTHKAIIIPILVLLIYVGSQVFILDRIGIWEAFLVKDLVIWIIGFALVSMINVSNARRDKSFILKVLKDALALTVFVDFIINFYTFPFLVEIIFIPILVFLFVMQTYAELYEKYKDVVKFLNFILATIGFVIIYHVLRSLIIDPTNLFTYENLIAIGIPFVLSITFIPYLYMLALYVTYDDLIVVMNHILKRHGLGSYFVKKLLWKYKLNLGGLIDFNLHSRVRVVNATNKIEIDKIFKGK